MHEKAWRAAHDLFHIRKTAIQAAQVKLLMEKRARQMKTEQAAAGQAERKDVATSAIAASMHRRSAREAHLASLTQSNTGTGRRGGGHISALMDVEAIVRTSAYMNVCMSHITHPPT